MSIPAGGPAPYASYSPQRGVSFDAISEGWRYMQPQLNAWIPAALIYLAISFVLGLGLFAGIIYSVGGFEAITRKGMAAYNFLTFQFVYVVLYSALNAVCHGGFYRMAVRQLRGQALSVGDLFSAVDCFGPLFALYLIYGIGNTLLSLIPFGSILGWLVGICLGGALMLVPCLVVDQRLGLGEAVSQSWSAVSQQFFIALMFNLVVAFLMNIGTCACLVGGLFTVPLGICAISVVYRDLILGGVPAETPYYPSVAGTYIPPPVYPPAGSAPPPAPPQEPPAPPPGPS